MAMGKRRFVIGLVTSMALALGVFFGGRAASAAGADIYGVGGGSISMGGVVKFAKFAFSGHTGPQGDFGSARFTFEDPTTPLDVHIDVDCVDVFPVPLQGGGGWIGGPVTRVTPYPNVAGIQPGDEFVMGFNDFGEPSDPTPDEWTAVLSFAPQLCKLLGPSFHFPVNQGNINVKFEEDIISLLE
jgi:hypothetical protein